MTKDLLWSIEEYLRQHAVPHDDGTLRLIEQHFQPLINSLEDTLEVPRKDAAISRLEDLVSELEGKLEDKNERIDRFGEDINLVIDAARSGIKGKKDELVEGMHVIIGLCTGALQEFPK